MIFSNNTVAGGFLLQVVVGRIHYLYTYSLLVVTLLQLLFLCTNVQSDDDDIPFFCNAANDSCPTQFNRICESELAMNSSSSSSSSSTTTTTKCINGDCFDCDKCQIYELDCTNCIQNNCFWCPGDASCLSTTNYKFKRRSSCIDESDYTSTTCMFKSKKNFFSDPYYSAQAWVYNMINVIPIWREGIFGTGIRIRINDNGVDATHIELSKRFDIQSSCSIYLPPPQTTTTTSSSSNSDHGTTVASIIGAESNNNECIVGIAPKTILSSCYAFIPSDFTFLDTKLNTFDISQNSYNRDACKPRRINDDERRRRKRRHRHRHRHLTLQNNENNNNDDDCIFTFVNPINGVSPCDICDITSSINSTTTTTTTTITTDCEDAIIRHCRSYYEKDPIGCLEFLDLFIVAGQCKYNTLSDDQRQRLTNGILNGRNGKGIIFVFAAGNEYGTGEDINFEGFLNTRFTITVGAVGKDQLHASYSTPGAALFITAPGGDKETISNIIGAKIGGGGCMQAGYGTSYSSPVLSGVIALMLEVNPNLTWRDVQGILALTSRMVTYDPNDTTRITNAAGYNHSNFYGFGIVDAKAAVTASKSWINFNIEEMLVSESKQLNLIIPDHQNNNPSSSSSLTTTTTITSTLSITTTTIDGKNNKNTSEAEAAMDFITESVVVYLDLHHFSRGDLDIILTSPYGTESILHPGNRPENSQLNNNNNDNDNDNDENDDEQWKLLTVRNWGESAIGEWTISITDISNGYISDCVDYPLWEISIFNINNIQCIDVQSNSICIDGKLDTSFFPSNNLLTEFIETTDDINNLSVLDACCICGGGIVRSSTTTTTTTMVDQFVKWRLVVYGRSIPLPYESTSNPTTLEVVTNNPTLKSPPPPPPPATTIATDPSPVPGITPLPNNDSTISAAISRKPKSIVWFLLFPPLIYIYIYIYSVL